MPVTLICSRGHSFDVEDCARSTMCPVCFEPVIASDARVTLHKPEITIHKHASASANMDGTAEISHPLAMPSPEHLTLAHEGKPIAQPGSDQEIPGYQLLGELGRGAMGVVYKARQTRANRIVALKMILAGGHASPNDRIRFRKEAEAVACLQNVNIVQIFDVNEHDGRPYFSLEYCAGGSLAKKLGGKPLPPKEAAGLAEQLARGMSIAHAVGIVHRDLKPANVLLAEDGTPKVADFGLAKHLDGDSGATRSQAVMGTPAYMAPEQADGRSREVGTAADVYSLGAILYEMLTGRPPFKANSLSELLDQVKQHEPVAPRQISPKVPRDLETICLKCLRKEPGNRYADARGLADDLHRFLSFEPILARPVSNSERFARWLKRRPAVVLAACALVLLLIGSGIAIQLWKQREEARQQADRVRAANEEKVEYYSSLVRRFGEPEGVNPISEEEANRRLSTYRFTRRGGYVVRIDVINSFLPNEHSYLINPSRWALNIDVRLNLDYLDTDETFHCRERVHHLLRDNDGKLLTEEMRDAYGQLQWSCTWLDGERVCRVSEATGLGRARTRETRHLRFVWGPNGLAQEIWETDPNGVVTAQPGKWSGIRVEYDDRLAMRKWSCLNKAGTPATIVGNASTVLVDHDNEGRVVRIAIATKDGQPASIPATTASQLKIAHDTKGGMEMALVDQADQPAGLIFIFHKQTLRHDGKGKQLEQAYFGLKNQPVSTLNGHHRITRIYDDKGNVIEWKTFDTAGKPVFDPSMNAARSTKRFDERGALLEEIDYVADETGTYIPCAKFFATERVREKYLFTPKGRPVVDAKNGHHKLVQRYDERGRVVEGAYFGLDGIPMRSTKGGYHSWRLKYDFAGNEIERTYFDVDGAPTVSKQEGHRLTKSYNSHGKVVESTIYDVNGELFRDVNNSVKVNFQYNDLGEREETCFWTLRNDGKVVPRLRRNARDLVIEEVLFERDGRPKVHEEGWHRLTAKFDPRGNRTEVALFGLDGGPVYHREGWSSWKSSYDENNKQIELSYFGLKNEGIGYGKSGVHRLAYEYDRRGNLIATRYYGLDARPIAAFGFGYHRIEKHYDDRDRCVEERYFGLNDQPAISREGYHKRSWKYDGAGQSTVTLYDIEGKAISVKNK